MALVLILIAYYYDYKAHPKQFIADLRGGIQLVALLTSLLLFLVFVFKQSVLLSIICTTGIVFPIVLLITTFFKKK